MTAISEPGTPGAIPDRIARPLLDVSRRQWKLAAAGGALRTLLVALAAVLAASLLLGHLPTLSGPLRVAVAATAWAVVVAAAMHYLRPALRRPSLADAAFAVERCVPGLHERISSAVELSLGQSGTLAGSPLLLRHLVRQAEVDAAAVCPPAILPATAVKRSAALLAPVLLLWLTFAALTPRPLLAGAYRVLMPWRDHLPAALTTIAVTPGDVTLAEGDALEITATVNARSGFGGGTQTALLLTRGEGNERPVSRDLAAAGPRRFTASLSDVRQTFSYRVSVDGGESRWFSATVLPRPAVAQLDLRYDYPAYTAMDPVAVANSDGAIEAIQGTEVTVTVHAAGELNLADGKSRVAIAEGSRRRDAQFKSVDGKPGVYEASLTVFNSGTYRIHLANRHGLTNKDDQPRPIVADMDAAPKVAITAPASEVSVRADDDVPVAFAASDDFAVAGLRAMVQVDDKPPEAVDVDLSGDADRRRVEGTWTLAVPAHSSRADVDGVKTITYWLRATDNRDPDPQSAESAKQTLKIDNDQPLAYRTRVEQQQAKDLVAAIDKAVQRLGQAEWAINSLRDADRSRALNADEQKRAAEQRDHLAKTSEDLADAAASNLRNAFAPVAAKAKEIAELPIRGAAENTARALLNADQPELRRAAAAEAAAQRADARKQLDALKKAVEARSKDLQAARELEKIAQKQAELAAARPEPAERPDRDQRKQQEREQEKARQRQRELAERLQRAIGESEALRDPKAAEQAVRLRELLDRLERIQRDHAPLTEQSARQQEVASLQDRSEVLAARQRGLNQEIERFAGQHRSALHRAQTRPPEPQHQAGIIDRLRQNEPKQAHDMQRQSADQLKQASKQLQETSRSRDLRPDPAEQYAVQRREAAEASAKQAAEQSKRAAEQLKQANESKDAGQLAEAKKAVDDAAQAMTEQARAAADAVRDGAGSGDATAKKSAAESARAAGAAQAAAEAARAAAQRGDAAEAAKKLDEAAKHLAHAEDEALDATRAGLLAGQQAAAGSAAGLAKDLADRQAELAEATKQAAQALEQARRDQQSAQELANRHNQLKDRTRSAAQQADQLEQLARATYPSLADRAAAAESILKEAAAAEADAAQSQHAVAQAQQRRREAAERAARENQQAAQLRKQADDGAAKAAEQQQHAAAADRQATDVRARKDEAAAKSAAEKAAQARGRAEQDQKESEKLRQQAAVAEKKADDAAKRADAEQGSAASARQQAASHQTRAAEALAKAEAALRDLDRLAADLPARADPAGDGSRTSPADPQAPTGARANPEDPHGQEAAGEPKTGSPPSPRGPEQAKRQAAQGAQEAAQAQQQAIGNNADAAAMRQAAAALQQAAAAMSAATAAEASEPALAGSDEQAEGGADAHGARESASAAASPHSPDSKTGTGTGAGTHDGRPQSVQELGISAGDWARLAPLQRQELLNAAQQSGPPAYREMIKNYYVRIARLGRHGTAE